MRIFDKLLRYGATGGIAALVDAGGFALLLNAGIGVATAGILSFCVAAFVNYWLTAGFVFNRAKTVTGLALFFAFALAGLAVNVGTMLGLNHCLSVRPIFAKVGGIGVAFFLNFFLNAAIVFRAPR